MKNTLFNLIIILVLFLSFITTYNNEEISKIKTSYSPKQLADLYDKSQYTIPNSKNPISDAILYAHAGYKYTNGDNPHNINAEHLTTGKYIIGLFYVITGQIKSSSIFFVLTIFVLANFFLYKKTKGLLPLFIFSFFYVTDTNIRYQITGGPLLDIIQLFFLLLYIFLFSRLLHTKNKFIWVLATGISLGLMASSKMYIPAVIASMCSIVYIFISLPKKKLNCFILMSVILSVALLTYISTYIVYFVYYHGTPIEFIKSQLWIFHFWSDNPVNKVITIGAVIPLLMANKYHVWWGDRAIIPYEDWTIFWPIATILITSSCALIFWQQFKKNQQLEMKMKVDSVTLLVSIWIFIFFIYLLNIPISPRYLILLFVPGYILISLIAHEIYEKYKTKPKKE